MAKWYIDTLGNVERLADSKKPKRFQTRLPDPQSIPVDLLPDGGRLILMPVIDPFGRTVYFEMCLEEGGKRWLPNAREVPAKEIRERMGETFDE